MNTHNMNTTKLMTQAAILAILSVALLPGIVTAHDGEQHVIGVVAKGLSISPWLFTSIRCSYGIRRRRPQYSEAGSGLAGRGFRAGLGFEYRADVPVSEEVVRATVVSSTGDILRRAAGVSRYGLRFE